MAESDIIIAGRFVRYEASPNLSSTSDVSTDPKTGRERVFEAPPSVTERIELAIALVFKGAVTGPTITIVNHAFVDDPPSGMCGAKASDPTGRYTVTGLVRQDDGTYDYFYSFFVGDGPYGEGYQRALERMASFPGASSLPALGSGPGSSERIPTTLLVAAGLAAAAVAAGAALLGASLAMRVASRKHT